MNVRTRLRFVAAGAILMVAGTAGFLSPPATAHPPAVTIAPFADRVTTDDFAIDATVRHDEGTLTGKIELEILPGDGQPPVGAPPAQDANGQSSQSVRFTVGAIQYNGNYQAKVTATSVRSGPALLGGHGPTVGSATRSFLVLVPPVPPVGVNAAVDPDTRVVTVSWRPNPEKDLLGYLVQRDGGDPGFIRGTSFRDDSTASEGGKYVYKVQAVRRGATPDKGVTSDPVSATVTVPAAGGPPTTAPGGATASTTPGGATGAGATPGGSTGTTLPPSSAGALKKSGSIDLSGFSSMQGQARRPAGRSSTPDPGFTEALPFGTTNTTRLVGDDEQAGAAEVEPGGDDAEVRELGAEDASNERQRSAAFLAAGLLATVLLMHLLWIKGEVQREPLEALTPE